MPVREAGRFIGLLLPGNDPVSRWSQCFDHQPIGQDALSFVDKRLSELGGLDFTRDEKRLIAALQTPDRVQIFLDTFLTYNNDHLDASAVETAQSPKSVLHSGTAQCFEGLTLAYLINTVHKWNPRLVLLEASQDIHHNILVWQDPDTRFWGASAQSSLCTLRKREPVYDTLHGLARSYYPEYFSDRTKDRKKITLVGYSEPIDLIERFGTAWMGTQDPLWELYYTYITDTTKFYDIHDPEKATHLYPMIAALKNGWIEIHDGKPVVCPERLTEEARVIWFQFWDLYDKSEAHPTGYARELEMQFRKITATTPIDLAESVEEVELYLASGYPLNRIVDVRHHPS